MSPSCASQRAIIVSFVISYFMITVAGQPHECQRVCRGDEPPRRCVYDFQLEYYFTMSKACYDCPLNGTDCDRHHCISADGVERAVIVVNRQLPGPSIQVCEGDEIVVDVKNRLPGEGSSIHWHGQHMTKSPYMDGVPMITQCPISPGSTFRYVFTADIPGTHFWHSHTEFQRADGIFGSLIVRQSAEKDPHSHLYDFDLPDHVLLVSDWLGELGVTKFVAHHHDDGDNKPTSMLINGRGRLPRQLTVNETMPLTRFQVQQGHRYRFRAISNGFLNCPIQISVDNHTLLVIASDGHPMEPLEVDSFIISAGERYDFVLTAIQPAWSYWIRLHGLMDCKVNEVFQAAILQYTGAPDFEPSQELTYANTMRPGKTLNPVNIAPGDNLQVTVAETSSLDDNNTDWTREPDRTFYLAYDFNAVNNLHFHDPEHYPIFGVEKNHRLFTPQINNISLRMPPSPLLYQSDDLPPGTICNETTVSNCGAEFCDCTYTLNVPLGSLVEIVLIDEGFTFDATHPFHLHGTAFRVLAMHRVGSNVTVTQIKEMDRNGLIERNLIKAPIKDTVSVPDGGYTIVRFFATNPGYWLFHCHLSFHIEVGMGLIFKFGEHSDFPSPPKNFPTCGSWSPEESPLHVTTESPAEPNDGNTVNNELSPLGGTTYLNAQPTTTYRDNSIHDNQLVNGTLSHLELQPNFGTSAGLNVLPQFFLITCLKLSAFLYA